MKNELKRCGIDSMCAFMEKRLTDDRAGFRSIHTINGNRMRWRGVSYHESATDRGLLVNFCPWCGGKPGDMANRDTPNAPRQVSTRSGDNLDAVVGNFGSGEA